MNFARKSRPIEHAGESPVGQRFIRGTLEAVVRASMVFLDRTDQTILWVNGPKGHGVSESSLHP